MAKIPEFLFRALYVKGSLTNSDDGFEFQIKNELSPARETGALPSKVDRKPIALERCQFILSDTISGFCDDTPKNSVLMRKGEALTVRIQGTNLRRGRRTLGMGIILIDMGGVNFSVSNQVK